MRSSIAGVGKGPEMRAFRGFRRLAVVACVALALVPVSATGVAPRTTEVVTVTTGGVLPTEGGEDAAGPEAFVDDISGDGRYVVFSSWASDVVPGDDNDVVDVFVRDTVAGTTEIVSVSTAGDGGNGYSRSGSISDDGRYVVFQSEATNLVGLNTGGSRNIFLRDRVTGTTSLITASVLVGLAANGDSTHPVISGDGSTIVFSSTASNLVLGDGNGFRDVFMWSPSTGRQLVSATSAGVQGDADSGSVSPGAIDVSYDGRYICFASYATGLAPGDSDPSPSAHLYLRDTVESQMERVDLSTAGVLGGDQAFYPQISPSGRWVVFQSKAANLAPGDADTENDVFLRDRWMGTTALVSVSDTEAHVGEACTDPAISGDGNTIAFKTDGDLDATDTDTKLDMYVRDVRAGSTSLESVSSGGANSNAGCYDTVVTADGTVLGFNTQSDNLDPLDTNGLYHGYVRGLLPGTESSTEIEGTNRYKTAVAASKEAFPNGCETVVVATGANWPDALGGAALAGAVGAPLLLTDASSLPGEVEAEIDRLKADNAYILGGTGVVSAAVENELEVILTGDVTRLAGGDRYSTAREIADEVIALLGDAYDGGSFVSTGQNFPDALAASPLSAFLGRPILLAPASGAPSMPSEVRSTAILGGTGAVDASTQSKLEDVLGTSSVSRVAGDNRYDTAARLAEWGLPWGMHWNSVAIATGEAFPDGLSGGAAAGQRGSVMLLTPTASLASEARSRLIDNAEKIAGVHYVGGPAAVSDSVRSAVRNAVTE